MDEAHHFQAQERVATLTYGLLSELANAGRIGSLVLFTGTPHRGKDFGFLALMQLLRPDLFDPEKEMEEQLSALPQAMIRNNKALVTDLDGNKLFRPVETRAVDYSYSEAEEAFYHTMSEFILDGRAYAASLSGRQQTARMLLLIALQKLAAKATQALVHNALEAKFGKGCAGFINGDERLVVASADGVKITLPLSRDTAADDFNDCP